jgi:SAM-dependent methyltransferase
MSTNPYLAHRNTSEPNYAARKYPKLGFRSKDRNYHAPDQSYYRKQDEDYEMETEEVQENYYEYEENVDMIPDQEEPMKGAEFAKDKEVNTKQAFIHGNYASYYGYRSASKTRIDCRLAFFKPKWFNGKRVLDIGCNAGHVTLNIAMHLSPQSIEGVDIDPSLIRRARCLHATRASLISPDVNGDTNYFPISCTSSFGTLPMLHKSDDVFPYNVEFRAGDWVNERIPSDGEKYGVILALSVTKWIHLNGGT